MKPGTNSAPPAVMKRGPGHRAVDARDAIAELTERAQEISQEAGSRVAIAMKDVISAAAGLAGFAVESARDLVSFMVRRSQMTQEEADKLLREAELAHSKRPAAERRRPTASQVTAKERAAARAKAAAARDHAMAQQHMMRVAAVHAARQKPVKSTPTKRTSKPSKPKPKAKAKKKSGKRR